ncbi:DUF1269 domain-containing protein [Labilibacter marinus]|uniref:DUF1269 domain-containing protein n=1 Tax=Labilibacter marinus TaxID=1477105 RepID=UPI00094FA2DD|nr:DUF1269 domain-containing protein [Labilibacter marinus]
MNKMIVSVFDTEKQGYEGLSALKDLNKEGSISVYATSVVTKSIDNVVEVKEAAENGPLGTSIGLFTGSLIGMLGGPVGVLIGAGIGGMTGVIADLHKSGIDVEFMNEVSEALSPGKVALIANIEESWETPLDTRIEELSGMIFRRNRKEIIDEQLERESKEMKAEMLELKDEMKDANDEMKASLKSQIEKVKSKMEALSILTEKRLLEQKKESDAKLESLKQQLEEASQKKKTKLNKLMTEVHDNYSNYQNRLESIKKELYDELTESYKN